MVRSSLFMAGAVFGEVPSIVECHFLWQALYFGHLCVCTWRFPHWHGCARCDVVWVSQYLVFGDVARAMKRTASDKCRLHIPHCSPSPPKIVHFTFRSTPSIQNFTLHTLHWKLRTWNSALYTARFAPHYTPHYTLRLLDFTLHTPHLTVYTLHCAPYNPQSTRAIHNLHFTLCTTFYTSHSTLQNLHSTLHSLHSTLHSTLHTRHHSTLYTPHLTLHTPHSTLRTLHFTLRTLHSALYTSFSTFYTSHSTLCTARFTPHSTLNIGE